MNRSCLLYDNGVTPARVLLSPCDDHVTRAYVLLSPCDTYVTPAQVLLPPCDNDVTPAHVLLSPYDNDVTPSLSVRRARPGGVPPHVCALDGGALSAPPLGARPGAVHPPRGAGQHGGGGGGGQEGWPVGGVFGRPGEQFRGPEFAPQSPRGTNANGKACL
jgi:hypothetical protein